MANVSIKINNPKAIDRELLRELSVSRIPTLERKIAKLLQPKIVKLLLQSFRDTRFYKGLQGVYAGNEDLDVRAHAGLSDEMAQYAMIKLEQTFVAATKLQRRSDRLGLSIIINTNKFFRLQNELSYNSNGYEINWLSWFIHDESEEIEAFISFDALASVYGRSEEAIMIRTPGRFIYDITNYELGRENFLAETLENEKFVDKAISLVVNTYRRELDNL